MVTNDPTQLARLQRPITALMPEGVERVTNPLLSPRVLRERANHFDPDIFDLTPESHLSRLLRVLMGDAGVGQLHKLALIHRLGQTAQGTNFYDLDRLYGYLFRIPRADTEELSLDPTRETGTAAQWMQQHARDGSYRSRMLQFAHAINHGPTTLGATLAVEALLNVDCEVFEMWRYHDRPSLYTVDRSRTASRREIIVRPTRQLTLLEEYSLHKVLQRLKPADTVVTIDTTGILSHSEVSLRRASASSEHWEVVTLVPDLTVGTATPYGTGSGAMVELSRPPLSGYQGEAWSYNGDVTAVRAYTDKSDVNNFDRIRYPSGDYLSFLPEQALFSAQRLISGRLASDGIAVLNPYSRIWSEGQSPMSAFYIDHVSIDTLSRVLHNLPAGDSKPGSTDFWATPGRAQDDPTVEWLEVTFADTKLVNKVSFDVADFPHRSTVEVFDEDADQWVRVGVQTLHSSTPAMLSDRAFYFGHHPHHYGPGHWQRASYGFQPRRTQRIRVSLTRVTTGDGPVDMDESPVAYSLGVRNMEVGYRVRSRLDLPHIEDGEVFGTSINRFGTRVQFAYREDPVERVLVDDDQVWRCEPQPIRDAVVNLHLDTRDAQGRAQTIDRFYIDPVTEGVSAALYYSNEEPVGDFDPSDDPLAGVATGDIEVRSSYLDFDEAAVAYLDLAGKDIELDVEDGWWLAMRLYPAFASDDVGAHPLLAFDEVEVTFTQDALVLRDSGGTLASVPTSFLANGEVYVALVHAAATSVDFQQGLTLLYRLSDDSVWQSAHSASVGNLVRPSTIRIAGSVETPTDISGMGLLGMILKQEEPTQQAVDSFEGNASLTRPEFSDDPGQVRNALLRMGSVLVSDTSTYGVRGGPADRFSLIRWHPVARAYRLSKGTLSIPPIRARYWKFEFTHLAIEPYENFLQVESGVLQHNSATMAHYEQDMAERAAHHEVEPYAPATPNARTREAVRRQRSRGSDRDLPTSLAVAANEEMAERLRGRSWLFGYVNHHVPFDATPRFHGHGEHAYTTQGLRRSTKTAYFVGLRYITAYRIDSTVEQDTYVYDEAFLDDGRLASNDWTIDDVGLRAVESGNVAISTIYRSETPIEALQFAGTFAQPQQLLPDPGFDDEGYLSTTDWEDPNQWHVYGSARLFYRRSDHSVLVARSVPMTYGRIESTYATYGAIEPTAYNDLEAETSGGTDGGIASPPVVLESLPRRTYGELETDFATYGDMESEQYPELELSGFSEHVGSGRIYVAAAVTVSQPLDNPLWVQLVDQDDVVLAERPIEPVAGDVSTVWVAHDYSTPPEKMRGRVIQKEATGEVFYVLNLSIFEPTVIWEFSVDGGVNWYRADDVVNNPNGALRFPSSGKELRWRATAYNRSAWISALQVRPWYIGMPIQQAEAGVRGPDISPFDHHPPIESDPMFKQWSLPIPQRWFRTV